MKTLDRETLYDALYEEEDARVCKDISDEACTNVPDNFFLLAAIMATSKLADALANAKTTLPWLLTAAGAPAWIASVMVPIRESGSMLPQLAIGGWVRTSQHRKWWYVLGAALQAAALLGMAVGLVTLNGVLAGWSTLVLVVLMSLSRGFCSVAAKDVIGKTVPKTRRGRVTGLAATVAGVGTIAATLLLLNSQPSVSSYVYLLVAAGVCWVIAAFSMGRVKEEAGATEGGANGLKQGLAALSLLQDDLAFRRFVIARALLMGSALSAPFIVVLAQQQTDARLTFFLFAQGLASLLSGYVWGVVADYSSRRLMMLVAVLTAVIGGSVFVSESAGVTVTSTYWFYPTMFFLLAIVHDGVRLGRKTYLVDLGGGDKRTDYVAVSNTVIGALLLVVGAATSALAQFGPPVAILVLTLMALGSLYFLMQLPETQENPG